MSLPLDDGGEVPSGRQGNYTEVTSSTTKSLKETGNRISPDADAVLSAELAGMIPRSEQAAATVLVATSKPGKVGSKSGAIMSMDFILQDADLGKGLTLSKDAKLRATSSELVKDIFLEDVDVATTAVANDRHGAATRQQATSHSSRLDDCPMLELTEKLGRITTGDDIMTENIRANSSEWIGDFRQESVGSVAPNLFSEYHPKPTLSSTMAPPPTPIATPTPIPLSHTRLVHPKFSDEEYEIPLNDVKELLQVVTPTPTPVKSSLVQSAPFPASVTSSAKTKPSVAKSKKRRKRVIDESHSCEPRENDVLFGRGGYTNTHPGNIRFRKQAFELRSWYEQSSKEEKYKISDLLVESVKSEGNRFLEKGKDGNWYEVVGNGARKKASQALRERVSRKKLSGSLTKPSGESGRKEEDGLAVSAEEEEELASLLIQPDEAPSSGTGPGSFEV